jgi:hypothetical protein
VELKDFVKTTIEQIVEGVSAAQEAVKARGAIVNPASQSFQRDGTWNTHDSPMTQEVIFDVALTATDKRGTTEGIGVFLGSVNLGKKNEAGVEQVAVTKVKFSVPLVLPPGEKSAR